VIISSDNGMAFPFSKANLYMHSTRTPLIFWSDRLPQRAKIDDKHVVSGIDIGPTILDIMDITSKVEFDGKSILPIIKGDVQESRQFVFTQFDTTSAGRDYPMRAIIGQQYGYIVNVWSDGKTQFVSESQNGLTMEAIRRAAKSDPAINQRMLFDLYRIGEEFYDYEADPNAKKNLIAHHEYEDIIGQYRERLIEHLRQSRDPISQSLEAYLNPTMIDLH